MKKIKYRKIISEIAMIHSLTKSYKKTYCKYARIMRKEKKLKYKISIQKKMALAVDFLNFYYVKRGYRYFYQIKILKIKNIKKPNYKKMNVLIKKHSYTRDELLAILFNNL